MQLVELENVIVKLETERKEMLKAERPLQEEKADLKMATAKIKLRLLEIDKILEKSDHELKINNINLSLAKKEFWSLKNELSV